MKTATYAQQRQCKAGKKKETGRAEIVIVLIAAVILVLAFYSSSLPVEQVSALAGAFKSNIMYLK